jgi:hypothetical protein
MHKRKILAFLLLGVMQVCVPKGRAQGAKVIVWGVASNTPEWNRALGVWGTRQGCSSSPSSCVHLAKELAHKYHVKVFLAIALNSTTPEYALQYSQLSSSAPDLVEVGFDDFVSLYRKLDSSSADAKSAIQSTIDNLKSINPKLKFGISLYEDELESPFVQDSKLPAAIRARFDYIHLYPHFRKNGVNFTRYVPEVKRRFPNARIIAGAYAYDRRNYLSCSQNGRSACSVDEELALFQKTMAIETGLLKDGTVDAIEFYPGNFGHEGQWKGWRNPRACRPGDQDACIQTTKQLQEIAIKELGRQSPDQ